MIFLELFLMQKTYNNKEYIILITIECFILYNNIFNEKFDTKEQQRTIYMILS